VINAGEFKYLLTLYMLELQRKASIVYICTSIVVELKQTCFE